MSRITALAISVSILGGIATWLFLTVGSILIWAAFLAWACFYHSGGDEAAFKSTAICNVFGVLVASTTALIISTFPAGNVLGATVWPSVMVTVSVAIYILAAQIPLLASIPGTTYGYAAAFAFLLQTPEKFTPQAIGSLSLNSSYVVVSISMVIGAMFAYASAKVADRLVRGDKQGETQRQSG